MFANTEETKTQWRYLNICILVLVECMYIGIGGVMHVGDIMYGTTVIRFCCNIRCISMTRS